MNQQVLSKPQSARFLGVHPQTINNMIRRGEIPFIQISVKRVGIALEDLQAHITSHRKTQAA